MATEPPVGSILAFIGALNTLPAEWQPCDGRIVNDPASPFNGHALPDLMHERFLMGVSAATAVGQIGGSNNISLENAHVHGGGTDIGGHTPWSPGSQFQTAGGQTNDHLHRITTDPQGAHNHGGDNRPAFVGTYFIVRIK